MRYLTPDHPIMSVIKNRPLLGCETQAPNVFSLAVGTGETVLIADSAERGLQLLADQFSSSFGSGGAERSSGAAGGRRRCRRFVL